MTYLDWAATAPPAPEVIAYMADTAGEYYGNPSSLHPEGQKARNALEDARQRCAAILNCSPDQLAFTSGGTESNAIALLSYLNNPTAGTILATNLEHPSVNDPLRILSSCGWKVKTLQSDPAGFINPDKLKTILTKTPDVRGVVCMAVSNELGAIQPIREISEVIRFAEKNGHRPLHFHSDMVQTVGRIPINLSLSRVDTASFSAHKFRGPRGVGLFYHRRNRYNALLRGGGQENNVRPGTQNVAGARAMALALEQYGRTDPTLRKKEEWLIYRLMSIQGSRIIPENRKPENSCYAPGIIAVAFPPLPGEVLARMLAESGYAVSTGSACSSNSRNQLPASIASLNLPGGIAKCIIRISFGSTTSKEELEGFITTLQSIIVNRG